MTGGDAPDIAIVPQPGLLKTLVDTGKVMPAPEAVESAVDENWSEDWKKYGTFDDTFYAAPMLANLKGYVWYSPKQFAEWGVEVPETWDDMIALTDTIVEKTGGRPGARASPPRRHPAGRERTGSRTSSCASRAPRSMTTGWPAT
ncbi:extracellular solute-binding protein [Microbacterium sp. NRRL B-14842]